MASTHDYESDQRNEDIQIYINGEFYHRRDAKISVFDSGFLLGDGVWEGIRLHNGNLCFQEEHIKRLFQGLKTLQIEIEANETSELRFRNVIPMAQKVTKCIDYISKSEFSLASISMCNVLGSDSELHGNLFLFRLLRKNLCRTE